VYFFYNAFWAPALVVIGLWALLQFVSGIGQIVVSEQTGGVAYMAHIGGFVFGLVVGFLARSWATARLRGA
jgi:membrane associated rhomboid family serine protease